MEDERKMLICLKLPRFYPIIILSCFCFLAGCGRWLNYERDARSFTSQDLTMIEQKTGISLPTGSKGMNLYNARAQMDPSFLAKIEIPIASREVLIEELGKMPTETVEMTNNLIEQVNWWHPTSASTLIERRFYTQGHSFVDALLCHENGKAILYLRWSTD